MTHIITSSRGARTTLIPPGTPAIHIMPASIPKASAYRPIGKAYSFPMNTVPTFTSSTGGPEPGSARMACRRSFTRPTSVRSAAMKSAPAPVGRTANKGMEGLAITPDGNTLVGIMQDALIQDANQGGAAANLLRVVAIDVASRATKEYAYLLTTGTGVSEIWLSTITNSWWMNATGKGVREKATGQATTLS